MSKKKILITGGAGYIGSILSERLLSRGYEVICLDPCLHGEEPVKDLLEKEGFTLLKQTLKEFDSRLLKGVHAVIHLAALVGDPAGSVDEDDTLDINYLSTVKLAEAAQAYKVERFIFASTASCYGAGPYELHEGSWTNPLSAYAKTKLACENALLKYPKINPTIIRTATVFGPSRRMRFDLVINIMVAKAMQEGKLDVFGGDQWRPFIYTEDLVSAYTLILESPLWKVSNQTFNIVGNCITITDLGEQIAATLNAKVVKHPADFDKRDYRISGSKAREVLGFIPDWDIHKGVLGIRDWIKENNVDITDRRYSNFKTWKTYKELLEKGEVDKI